MKYPNLNEEKKLWKEGVDFVIGLDEAGRGPLAGPVVAAAVMLVNPKFQTQIPKKCPSPNAQVLDICYRDFFRASGLAFGNLKIKDSKQLTPKKRERVYKFISAHKNIKWGVGIVSENVIDRINILEATKLAMINAIEDMGLKTSNANFLLIDGNFRINSDMRQKSIVKGDEKVFSIAAASIIAKVTRDRIMAKYHKKFPEYGFSRHKGYGTKYHFEMIKKHGISEIHRKSFCLHLES